MVERRFDTDRRIVMTLDAGGTTLKFSAIQGNNLLLAPLRVPSEPHHLQRCLSRIIEGFEQVQEVLPEPATAISFAFPGPADYPAGIIGDLPNLTAFRGGVPLGPMLEDRFGIPVFINNDGDLFTYGEAIAGFLPWVNSLLENAGNPKRYRNLFGITLGTGLGGGVVVNGELLVGDNSIAGEAWLLRNRLDAHLHAEEGACIRAVRSHFSEEARVAEEACPEPHEIFDIGMGVKAGNRRAAERAFQRLGRVAGDAVGQALTLLDGLAVIGGGISAAYPLFLPALVAEMNGAYQINGKDVRRLISHAYNIEDPAEREAFLQYGAIRLTVPGSDRMVSYDAAPRTAVGVSRLGTSEAVAIGAYAFALSRLN